MSQAVWKLTTLAGVVGIGLLVVMNAQRGLQQQAGKTPALAVKNAANNKPGNALDELPENEEPPLGGPEEFGGPVNAGDKNGPDRLPTRQPTPASDDPFDDKTENGLDDNPRSLKPRTAAPTPVKPLVRHPDPDEEPLTHEEHADEHPGSKQLPGRKDQRNARSDSLHMAAANFPAEVDTEPAQPTFGEETGHNRVDPDELPIGRTPVSESTDDRRQLPPDTPANEPTDTENVAPYVPKARNNGPATAARHNDEDDRFGAGSTPRTTATDPHGENPGLVETELPEVGPTRRPLAPIANELEEVPESIAPVKPATPAPDIHKDEDSFAGSREVPTTPAVREAEEIDGGLQEPGPMPSSRRNNSPADPDRFPGESLTPEAEPDIDAISPTNPPAAPREPDPERIGPDRLDEDSIGPDRGPPNSIRPEAATGPLPGAPLPDAARVPEHAEEVIRTRDSAPSLSDLDTSGEVSGDRPSVEISKVTPPSAVIGQPLVYEIFVRNTGTCRAARVVVEDRLSRNVELNGTRPQAEAIENRLIWKLGVLEPGEERKIGVRVIPLNEGRMGSVATVSFVSGPADTIVATPRLRLEVTAPPRGTLGAPVPFRYRITNVGRTAAKNVVIRNPLPEGLSHPDGVDLEYAVGDLAPGETKEAELALTAAKEGETINRAIATADGGDTVSAESRLKVYAATFTLTRVGPKRLYLRKPGSFNNRVVNTGSRPLENVSIVEIIPEGLQFVSASNSGQYDEQAHTVTWRFPRIAPNQSEAVSIVLASVGRGQHSSVVRCIDGSGAMAEIDNMSTAQGFSSLRVTMSEIESPLIIGDRISTQVRVINRGSEPANNVRIAIGIPAPLNVLDVKGLDGAKQERGQLVFPPITLEPKQEVLLDISLEARTVGEARLQAFVQSDRLTDPLRTDEHTTVVSTTD